MLEHLEFSIGRFGNPFSSSRFWISTNRLPTDSDDLIVGFSEFLDFFG